MIPPENRHHSQPLNHSTALQRIENRKTPSSSSSCVVFYCGWINICWEKGNKYVGIFNVFISSTSFNLTRLSQDQLDALITTNRATFLFNWILQAKQSLGSSTKSWKKNDRSKSSYSILILSASILYLGIKTYYLQSVNNCWKYFWHG